MKAHNIYGKALASCCLDPATGYYRDGYCRTGAGDVGLHTVCSVVTEEFLNFSKKLGNDLITPRPEYDFPGLKPGDSWCLCVRRWMEAHAAGFAPKINLEATHISALEFVDLSVLEENSI